VGIKTGFLSIVLVVVVAIILAATVGFGVYLKSKNDQMLDYKTQKKIDTLKGTKPTLKQLGLSSGNEITDIDADMKTVSFDGLDGYLNEVSANINTQ